MEEERGEEEDQEEEKEGTKDEKKIWGWGEVQNPHKQDVGKISQNLRFGNWVHSLIHYINTVFIKHLVCLKSIN